jgi:hypothetical protein
MYQRWNVVNWQRYVDLHTFGEGGAMVPYEIQKKKQWTYSYSKDNLKRPFYSRYKPNGALTYPAAKKKAGSKLLVGFYTTRQDPYILIDVDHTTNLDELPDELTTLFKMVPTYTEVSPSGNGLRVIYKLKDANLKKKLKGNSFYAKKEFKDDKRNIQLNIDKPWMTITGISLKKKWRKISVIELDALEKVFNFNRERPDLKPVKDTDVLPPISAVAAAIDNIPLDQNLRVKRSFEQLTGNEYHHYDFWLKTLMALHDYARKSNQLVQCLDIAINWSQKDPDAFKSQDEVIGKWKSFSDKPLGISYKTLFKMSSLNIMKWPKPRKITKTQIKTGNVKTKPYIMSLQNFHYLLKYYNIQFHIDEWDKNVFYLSGDMDILEKYFLVGGKKKYFEKYIGPFDIKSFAAISNLFMEDHDFDGISMSKIRDNVEATLKGSTQTINFFHEYMNTPFEELPEELQENKDNYNNSTFDELWSCIEVNSLDEGEIKLYKTYYKKWFMTLIRNLVLPETDYNMNIGILILTGREQIRKTTHFGCLLPRFFRDKIVFTTHGFSTTGGIRDVTKISSNSFIVIWDEFEQYLTPETESNFKKLMDANAQSFIDKYEVSVSLFKPISVYGATSNKEHFKLSSLTSRRFLHIPVKWVDTDKMMSMCWYPILHELLDEITSSKEKAPWLLTEEELDHQALLHQELNSKTELEYELLDMFDFESVFTPMLYHDPIIYLKNNDLIMKAKDVRAYVSQYSPNMIKLSALRHTLQKLCSMYTNTVRVDKVINNPKTRLVIHKGVISYGSAKYYVMPPKKEQDDPFQ